MCRDEIVTCEWVARSDGPDFMHCTEPEMGLPEAICVRFPALVSIPQVRSGGSALANCGRFWLALETAGHSELRSVRWRARTLELFDFEFGTTR